MTLTAARQLQILQFVESDREVLVADLARKLGVSEMTIRRDLRQLEQEGRLKRVHGGAIPRPVPEALPLRERMHHQEAAKRAIAKVAARLVKKGHRVFVGAGSTALALAREMALGPACRVLAGTPEIVETLAGDGRHELELTGGRYDPLYRSLYGENVLNTVRDRLFDIAFIAAYAVDAELGVLDNGDLQFHLQRILAKQARLYVVLADHTKFGRPANFRTLPWPVIDVLVTDREPDDSYAESLKTAGTRLLWPDQPA